MGNTIGYHGEMKKTHTLYSGKAKTIYQTNCEQFLVMEFRDDTSAFDGEKIEKLDRKGLVNKGLYF